MGQLQKLIAMGARGMIHGLELIAIAVAMCGFVSVSMAGGHQNGYGSPQGFFDQPTSVSQLTRNCKDDQIVVMRGRLTRYLGDEYYEFTDENGDTIAAELDDDMDWSFIRKDQLIEIMGELDKDMFSISVDVKRATALEN